MIICTGSPVTICYYIIIIVVSFVCIRASTLMRSVVLYMHASGNLHSGLGAGWQLMTE